MQASVFGDLENLSNEELAEVIQTPSLYQELCAHFLGKFETLRGVQVGRRATSCFCQILWFHGNPGGLYCMWLSLEHSSVPSSGQPCDFSFAIADRRQALFCVL